MVLQDVPMPPVESPVACPACGNPPKTAILKLEIVLDAVLTPVSTITLSELPYRAVYWRSRVPWSCALDWSRRTLCQKLGPSRPPPFPPHPQQSGRRWRHLCTRRRRLLSFSG